MYLKEDLMVTLEIFHCLKSTDSYKHYIYLSEKSDLPNHPKRRGGRKKKEHICSTTFVDKLHTVVRLTCFFNPHNSCFIKRSMFLLQFPIFMEL